MEKSELLGQLTLIFRDVLENETLVLGEDSTAATTEEWNSLNHILLVVAIEKHFAIRFTSSEIQNWKNVGEICNSIVSKSAKK